jgi:hypothetical protein
MTSWEATSSLASVCTQPLVDLEYWNGVLEWSTGLDCWTGCDMSNPVQPCTCSLLKHSPYQGRRAHAMQWQIQRGFHGFHWNPLFRR